MLKTLKRSREQKEAARRICAALMARARMPEFFTRFGVPDTMDGRFDLVALHAWLALERLEGRPALIQALIDEIFIGFDEALRHMGTGDIGMNRRLKTMAGAFYGRLAAYRSARTADDLAEAILRNVYRGTESRKADAKVLAAYALACRSHSMNLDPGDPGAGLEFGPLPNM